MAPDAKRRVQLVKENFKLNKARKAAILCLFYPIDSMPHFVLIKRVSYEGVHSGQISFPGGQIEDNESPVETAIRETYEEIGVAIKKDDILSHLTETYIPPSNFYVYPFIACLKHLPNFRLDKKEVDYIVEVPVDEFINPENIQRKTLKYSYGTFDAPFFNVQNEVVWGATAMMLAEVFEILQFSNGSLK